MRHPEKPTDAGLMATAETVSSMISLLAFSFGIWAVTAQMNWTSGFLFSWLPLRHWATWAAALVISLSARNLIRRSSASRQLTSVAPKLTPALVTHSHGQMSEMNKPNGF